MTNCLNTLQQTPLYLAAENNNLDIIDYLLNRLVQFNFLYNLNQKNRTIQKINFFPSTVVLTLTSGLLIQ
jgi:ankyrin repeat protein